MKKLLYRLVTGALLLTWMGVIFWFSAQPATESEEISGSVSYRVVEVCNRIFDKDMTEAAVLLWANRIDHPIRKAAHMTEYAVLAFLVGVCMLGYLDREKKIYLSALFFAASYAVTDEIHQLYVVGRAGRFSDVCIDTLGAAMGLLLFGIVLKLVKSIAKSRGFH
ncbi:MAG: VanZ family protein [Clostridiales bacterium]|nr:VanZ family protein [Roseburia sp.]MDD7636497.1 VanZ family protein [Clostridiales bacterium]MDY4112183.1 VanZ family protein [Roseburia sp.]